jgi:hypothetical protein
MYNVKSIDVFERQARRLLRKYPSLAVELRQLLLQLQENPIMGASLGNGCYKIRIAIKSKGKGRRGGARVITNFVVHDGIVYLLAIYDKSEKANISNKELKELLACLPL